MYTFAMILVAISIPLCIVGVSIVVKEACYIIEDAIWERKSRKR